MMKICRCCYQINTLYIEKIILKTTNDNKLNNTLQIYYCIDCDFYYTESNNTQEDYNEYYTKTNNYTKGTIYCDKDQRCHQYLYDKLLNYNVNTIIDYGCGNGYLSKLLSEKFIVTEFDIGMKTNTNKYDCLILSHVLEHIYDINIFIKTISENISENGLLYIEVPNAEYYKEFTEICPLQEINIEHINFFSKYSLNKLLLNNNYVALNIDDDYFNIKQNKYHVIRGIFKKKEVNVSFMEYLKDGISKIDSFNYKNLQPYKKIYVYGCGQFLFKIINKLLENVIIINIIDDNKLYTNKLIGDITIINYEMFELQVNNCDVILLTTFVYDDIIRQKLSLIKKEIKIITLPDI